MQLQQTSRGGTASENVVIPDPNLKAALLAYMRKKGFIGSDATEITEAQAQQVTDLSNYSETWNEDYTPCITSDPAPLPYKKIQHLDGLEKFTQLKKLDLSGNNISDLTPLKDLKSLEILELYNNKISNVRSLSNLTNLKLLDLGNASIRDWSPLYKISSLQFLYLCDCNLADLKPLMPVFNNNHELLTLGLASNRITDISPLQGLSKLKYLSLYENPIIYISPLKGLSNLKEVDLKNIEITRKASASTIDLSTLWPYAQYCTFSFQPLTDNNDNNDMTSSAVTSLPEGTIQDKTFTLKSLPPDKKITLYFMVAQDSISSLYESLGVKVKEGDDGGVYYSGTIVLDYSSEEEPQVGPLYRLYNPYTHEHFFTAETVENDNLVRLGWKSEGGVGYIYKHGEKGGVYRLYNPSTGEHHYTMNEHEVATCVKNGWKNEGVKWFSAQNKEVTLNKLYSMYNPYEKKFYHHYTADAKEIEQMVKAGWRKEEVKWCTLPVSAVK